MGKGFGVCGLWFRVKGHGVQRLGSSMLGHRFSGFEGLGVGLYDDYGLVFGGVGVWECFRVLSSTLWRIFGFGV
jgi:hypothetical protein